jgi:hypothetical protein
VADDPAEVTRTTCGAVTPAGTWQVAADGVGDGRGDGLGAGRLEVEGFALDLVAEGRCEGFGLARVVDAGRVVAVVREDVAVGLVEALEAGLPAVVGGAVAGWSAPQPAAPRTPSVVTAARTAVGTARVRVRLIGRSAGGRGCSTGRPSAAPAT